MLDKRFNKLTQNDLSYFIITMNPSEINPPFNFPEQGTGIYYGKRKIFQHGSRRYQS